MAIRIVVTSPHNDVTNTVYMVGNELSLNVTVFNAVLEDAVTLVKTVLADPLHDVGVIISRGATLQLLRKELFSLPIISIDPTEYDVLLALDEARSLGKKIGFLASNPRIEEIVDRVSTILRVHVHVYAYSNWQEFYVKTERAKREGIDVLIGGGETGARLSNDRGIRHIHLLSSDSTVRQALERARDVIDSTRREKEYAESLRAIVAYSHEGIMAINAQNIVSVFNPVACKVFNLRETDVLGHPLSDVNFRRSLVEMFVGPEERLGYIHKTRDEVLLVNKVPINHGSSFRGTVVTFKDITSIQEEESKIRRELSAKGLVAKFMFEDIEHVSSSMGAAITKAKKFANTDSTVFIRGESGTGKELIAQSLHSGHLKRAKRPFVAVNCAALDDNLLKSELFGYEDGAFTGARRGGRQGLFELAHGGTLFLDEIGKIKLDLQANLLRVLQEKEVRRIGSDHIIPVDVRIVAASNENIERLIAAGQFREDLYFRLNVLNIFVPPLRERRQDIPGLVSVLLRKYSDKYQKSIFILPQFAIRRLAQLEWPGNVRQLEHMIERCVVLADGEAEASEIILELIDEECKSITNQGQLSENQRNGIVINMGTLKEMETELVYKVSKEIRVSKTELAQKLGISRPTLLRLLRQKD